MNQYTTFVRKNNGGCSVRRTALCFSLAAALLAGCAHTGTQREEHIARGWMERSALFSPEYQAFRTTYDTVSVGKPFVEMLKSVSSGVETIVFLGTWCSDSRREVPRFFKLADEAGIPPASIRLYGLDRTKKSNDGLTDQYAIVLLPTFVFMKGGKELGRIVESPQATIEQDMVTILAKAASAP
jgi:thiol-disulfide isomerase/thioredoxin